MLLKNKVEIEKWLNKYKIENYDLIEDKEYGYVVNVNCGVDLSKKKLKEIKVKFNIVNGDFFCGANELESLEGCPEIVNRDFGCNFNKLKVLIKGPKEVGKSYYANNNLLESLEGCPDRINGNLFISSNLLKDLKGISKEIKGDLFLIYNDLEKDKLSKYFPEYVGGALMLKNNKLGIDFENKTFKEIKEIFDILKEKTDLIRAVEKTDLLRVIVTNKSVESTDLIGSVVVDKKIKINKI